MSLVDVNERLPGLQRRKGLTTWTVYDKQMKALSKRDDWEATGTAAKGKKEKPPAATCWPNGKEHEFGLEKCLRLYPHLQDTGGFFVAVLQKAEKATQGGHAKPEIAEEVEAVAKEVAQEAETSAVPSDAQKKRPISPSAENAVAKRVKPMEGAEEASSELKSASLNEDNDHSTEGGGRPFNEEPYTFLSSDDDQVKICRSVARRQILQAARQLKFMCSDFFGLKKDFPVDSLFVRNGEGKALRSIYLTSPAIRNVISVNDYRRMRLVSCGVKLFARQDSGNSDTYACKWRILQDGLNVISEYMSPKRKIRANLATLKRMIEEQYAGIDSFGDEQFVKDVRALGNGSAICTIEAGDMAGGKLESSIDVPIWRAPVSICLMVEKMEKRGLSLRIFGEDLSKNAYKKKEAKADGAVDPPESEERAAAATEAEEAMVQEEQGAETVA